ncbi:hypothetical protein FO519_009792 [Halicephalobus sp. NKZ332]|nr:hypothetical protein FO519_009792 [Halicephalobus sp. NKZ332]
MVKGKKVYASERDIKQEIPSEKSKFDHDTILKYTIIFVLIFQNAGQFLFTRYAVTRPQEQFLTSVAIFFMEVVKFITSFILLYFTNRSFIKTLKDIKHCFFTNWLETLKVGIPALAYTLQNLLFYLGIENLETATFMVIHQLRVLTTAAFTVSILKRRLSLLQWISLVILIIGVSLVQLNAEEGTKNPTGVSNSNETKIITNTVSPKHNNPIIGLGAALGSAILSGFAGVYFEKVVKMSDVSIWMRNFQLSALSLPISAVMIIVINGKAVYQKGLMQGFDWVVWGVVFYLALGGIIVAVTIKYADNILKTFATSLSIIVGTIAAIYVFNDWPGLLFLVGAPLVIVSVAIYSIFPYKESPSEITAEEGTVDQEE